MSAVPLLRFFVRISGFRTEPEFNRNGIQVHLNRGRKKVFTRNGLNWTKRFTEIAGALAIPGEAIIDGEVVVIHEGRTNFSELQAELAAGRQGRLVYYAFDLLWRDGDLRKLPQIERKHDCSTFSAETTSRCPSSTPNISPATGRRCLSTPPS